MLGENGRVIVAAADGSSLSNPGPAGWAWYIDDDRWAAGGWPHGTNNMGELMAVLDLLRQTAGADEPLLVLCDSQYVINSVTKWLPSWKRRGWRKADGRPVLNLELLQGLDAALAGRKVSFEWVKGHAGHDLNEAADERARAAATAFQRGTPVDPGPGFGPRPAPPGPDSPVAESPQVLPQGQREADSSVAESPLSRRPEAAPAPEPDLFSDDSAETVHTIVDLEKVLLSDAVRADRERMSALLHPDFVEVGISGHVWTRARALVSPAPLGGRHEFEQLGADRLTPDLVLLRYRLRTPAGNQLRTSLWQRHEGRWMVRFHQGTPVS